MSLPMKHRSSGVDLLAKRMGLRLALSMLLAAFGLVVGSCAALLPRIVPIQNGRVFQTERFHQDFRVSSVPSAERMIRRVLGPRNYDALSGAEWAPYLENFAAGRVQAIGNVTFIISLTPTDLDKYYVEGWGHYTIIDRSSAVVLFSGSFDIIDDGAHSVSELRSGTLRLRVTQTLQRDFALDKERFIHESEISMLVHLRKIGDELFIVDYDSRHEVGIRGDSGKFEVIGCMQFAHHPDGRKVIDLRGRDMIRDDYAERLAAAGFQPARPVPRQQWVDLKSCERGARDAACLCEKAAHPGEG